MHTKNPCYKQLGLTLVCFIILSICYWQVMMHPGILMQMQTWTQTYPSVFPVILTLNHQHRYRQSCIFNASNMDQVSFNTVG